MENELNAGSLMGVAGPAAHDLSLWGLFLQADIVVKIVMLLLLAASIWCWAIIFEKAIRLRRLRARSEEFEETFWSGGSLEDLYDRIGEDPPDPMAAVFAAAMREWRHAAGRGGGRLGEMRAGLTSRIERVMQVAQAREMARLERSMTFLASVGSTAPFIGLFGTVWGIMNAFIEIAEQQNTNLAVVAPGIAEALLATGLGLLAAIPAVIFYNKLSADSDRIVGGYEAFADEFSTILSRQLDS